MSKTSFIEVEVREGLYVTVRPNSSSIPFVVDIRESGATEHGQVTLRFDDIVRILSLVRDAMTSLFASSTPIMTGFDPPQDE